MSFVLEMILRSSLVVACALGALWLLRGAVHGTTVNA